jgi:C1A family cysteine protease
VLDQGNLGTCVTFATTEAMRYAIMKEGFSDVPLSCLQLYADARRLEGTSLTEDSGLEIRDAIKCAAKLGIAHDNLWPYHDDSITFTKAPPENVYTDALLNQALLYEAVTVNTQSVRAALAQGLPVVFGISLFTSFQRVRSDGIVPMPDPTRESIIGGHAMIIVGYGQKPGYFTVRNSWNTDWGDGGNCYIPEGYLTNTRYADDFWIIRVVEGFADSEQAKKLQAWIDNPEEAATS